MTIAAQVKPVLAQLKSEQANLNQYKRESPTRTAIRKRMATINASLTRLNSLSPAELGVAMQEQAGCLDKRTGRPVRRQGV